MTCAPKLAIAINLDDWRSLMRELVDEVAGDDESLKVEMEWTLEAYLQRLRRRRQETISDET